ncbi:MAG: hypothetical protein Kow00102_13160 [Spirochaetota bacterium]
MTFSDIVYDMMQKVNTIAKENKYNRYIKKHPVQKMFSIVLFHQYMGLHNGRSLLLQLKYILEKAIFRMIRFTSVDTNKRRQTCALLTNSNDMRNADIAELYRERWNIEIAFYWIKTFLKVNCWLSQTRYGVMIQLYSAFI